MLTYRKFGKHPSEMSRVELRWVLDDLPDARVVRSLLMAEVEVIRSGEVREPRTLRSLWYTLVKPALSRAGLLNKFTKGGNPVPWADKLSVYLSELVREGATSYEEMCIVDGSRQRRVAQGVWEPVAFVELIGAHFPYVILFTEKDTIWGVVEKLASLYGVSAVSGGGEPSLGCTEHTVKAILRSRRYSGQDLVLLSLTDYDPYGYHIARAQFTQLQEMVRGACLVRHERIGLEPCQLTPEERQRHAYTPKDKGLARWFRKTNGVDGEPLGLELDALPLSRLRAMFAGSIERHIDLDALHGDLQDAYLDLIACEELLPAFQAKRKARVEELKDEIGYLPVPEGLFRGAAVAGYNRINPRTLWSADRAIEL